MKLQKKILNKLHFVLGPLSKYYLSKPRNYTYKGIKLLVLPTVFHPGLFFSTKLFVDYLEKNIELTGKKVLEIGAGSGLISIACSRKGADVTSTDINDSAIEGLLLNARRNESPLRIIKSDLFDDIPDVVFDLIIITPPYYPKPIQSQRDLAWYCGENFEYFYRLFKQLSDVATGEHAPRIMMILSEDCRISEIKAIAEKNNLSMTVFHQQITWGEKNYLFDIRVRNQ